MTAALPGLLREPGSARYEQVMLAWPPVEAGVQAGRTPADDGGARKYARRVEGYAAKFAAETISYEPPRHVEPTDEALERTFAHCVKPAPRELYDDIRAAFARLAAERHESSEGRL
jgi:hypothetical protein